MIIGLFTSFGKYQIVQMISKYSIILLLLAIGTLSSESPYEGKITLKPIGASSTRESVYFRPLTEEPKIANFKDNEIQLTFVTEQNSCMPLPFVDDATPTFIIVDLSKIERLTCGIVNKINNIKIAGFKGFILVTDSPSFLKNHCRMYDDNHFFTGVMDSGNFSIILDYNNRGVASDPQFVVKGSLTIGLYNTPEKLIEVWINSFNSQSYEALEDLRYSLERLPSLEGSIQWTPRFATVDCTHGETEQVCQASEYVASCGCKGQFCSPEIRGKTPTPMVQQDIRQLMIYKQYPTKYLTYASLFSSQCLETYQREKYVQECATRIMNRLEIDSFSINQVVDTFLDTCVEENQSRESEIHQILERDQRAFAMYGQYPLVLINKEQISYKNQQDFKAALCTKLRLEDDNCFTVTQTTVQTESTSVAFYVILFISLVMIGGAVVYFYRRRLKKDMNKEIKMQVSTAVEHYFALTEASSAK